MSGRAHRQRPLARTSATWIPLAPEARPPAPEARPPAPEARPPAP
ncbi:MAG: hypothetical protein AAFQ43_06555 [Bacteroidota bacterium]